MSKVWSVLLMLFCLCACSGEKCIEADDFGFANLVVSARYSKDELAGQTGAQQVAPWRYSKYRVNGKPLAILVRGWTQGVERNKSSEVSAWCAWFGQMKQEHVLSSFCERLQDCQFVDDQMCTNTKDARIGNAPCIFRNGVGLYALIAEKGSDPNLTLSTQKSPAGITFHLGDPTVNYGMYDIDRKGTTRKAGGLVYNYEGGSASAHDLKQQYYDSQLYFKILDKFYDDNSGHYRISIKSGVEDTNPDPITFVTNLVKKFLFGDDSNYGLIRNIYTGVVNNPGYKTAVSAILSLYIIWTALSYLAGNVQLTHTELIVRVIKIAIIGGLLNSQYSWTFFNDYLFVWFVGGMGQILQMIVDAGASGPGASSIFGLMIAPQTLSKLFSLLFVDWLGFIYIILFFFALYFVTLIFFDAAVIYLTALISIGLIIVMGPIFICFLLFDITKSLFENWLKQLISYAVQPLILFTGLIFISMILRQEIYGSLGFRVCKQTFPKLSNDGMQVLSDATSDLLGFDIGDSLFYWWFPQPMKGEQFTRTTVNMPIPIDHYVTSGNNMVAKNTGDFCEAYACFGPRYVDLPFLDPVKDTRRLHQFWNGKFVQLDGMLLIFVAIYLLHKFNGLTVSIAKFITGTSGNLTDIKHVGDSARGGIGSGIGKVTGYVKDKFAKTQVGRAAIGIRDTVAQGIEQVKQAPSKMVDKARIAGLKKDALSSSPNKQVVDEVRKSVGLEHKDLKAGAVKNYKNALATELLKIDPQLTNRQARIIASKMSHGNFKGLENEFAKAKYGKELKDLTAEQKLAIKAITDGKSFKGRDEELAKAIYGKNTELNKLTPQQRNEIKSMSEKSLKELANDANASRKYQEAYVDAYAKLSDKGVGLLGKRSSAIRSLDELKHKMDTAEKLKEAKRKDTGEQLYAGLEDIKHKASGGVFGRSFNEIDTNEKAQNHRMQTYEEKMAESRRQQEYDATQKQIESLSKSKGESVISPEFLAKAEKRQDPNMDTYKNLAQADVKERVRKELIGDKDDKDPVLKGEKYMKEYAKDSEMVKMIDKAEKIKKEMLENDEFAGRKEQYENKFEIAQSKLLDQKETLEKHFNKGYISEQEMPAMLEQYNKEKGISPQQSKKEVEGLQQVLQEFKSSQEILQKIDERSNAIVEEVDRHIGSINKHRQNANMQEYKPANAVGTRSVRKIEDLRRGGK